jgi:hypothetical protein
MYWECAERFEEERGVVKEDETLFYKEYSLERIAGGLKKAAKSDNPDKERDAWFRMVQEYTSRDMTYQTDKLPALSGIISLLECELPTDKCYAGIWRSWFLRGLLWRLQVPEMDLYVTVPKPSHKVKWRAPSWSFASIEGVVLYDKTHDTSNICAQFLECSLSPKSNNNPHGELEKETGYANIRAPITSVVNIEPDLTRNGRACMIKLTDQSLVAASIYFDLDRYDACAALMITPHLGLAIVPVPNKNDTYLRVGLIQVSPLWDAMKNINLFRSANPPDRFLHAASLPGSTCITIV